MKNILAQKQNLCCIFMQKSVAFICDSVQSFAEKKKLFDKLSLLISVHFRWTESTVSADTESSPKVSISAETEISVDY